MAVEEAGMETQATNIEQMILQLNEFILPSCLMESFDAYRQEAVKDAAKPFNRAQLSWFLDVLNRFRGPDDCKESLLDIFDPGMYTCDHPAWEAAPGTGIEMPALTSDVAKFVDKDSEFAAVAREEINEFRDHADTYADEEIISLAKIARAALVDQGRTFRGREDAIRYLALNASAALEDLWAYDDTLWKNASMRHIEFTDMVAKRKADLMSDASLRSCFGEVDFACYSEEDIRRFAFDLRILFLSNRAKHLAICTRCQTKLESWTRLVEKFDQSMPLQNRRPDA
jgi:hypothetical protein